MRIYSIQNNNFFGALGKQASRQTQQELAAAKDSLLYGMPKDKPKKPNTMKQVREDQINASWKEYKEASDSQIAKQIKACWDTQQKKIKRVLKRARQSALKAGL